MNNFELKVEEVVPEFMENSYDYLNNSKKAIAGLSDDDKEQVKELLKQVRTIQAFENLCVIIEKNGEQIIKAYSSIEIQMFLQILKK